MNSPQGRLFRWFAGEMVSAVVAQEGAETTVTLGDQRYGMVTRPAKVVLRLVPSVRAEE